MRNLVTITFIFTCLFSFGQSDMFWNNYSNYNPAMSGFQYKQHGALSYTDFYRNHTPSYLTANYNIRLADKHGVGLNYSGTYSFYNTANVMANYNYQFNLKKAGHLSAGIGAGFNSVYDNKNESPPHILVHVIPRSNVQVNLGLAYKWKGLSSGVSIYNSSRLKSSQSTQEFALNKPGFVAHSAYEFKLGKRFQLTPRAIFRFRGGNGSLAGDITAKFDNKFSLGMMYAANQQLGFHVGWDILEKFRVAYSYNASVKAQSPEFFNHGRHQLTVGFLLK